MMTTVEKIKKDGQRYNSSLKRLGEQLNEIAEILEEACKGLGGVYFQHGNIAFDDEGPSSRIGSWGSCFYYVEEDEEGYEVRRLASTTKTCSFYLHSDFNCYVRVASRKEKRYVAQNLPEFLEAFGKWLEKKGLETEKAVSLLDTMIQAVKCKGSEETSNG